MKCFSVFVRSYIQKILLHDGVEDDGDEEIEDDGGAVFPSIVVKRHLSIFMQANQTSVKVAMQHQRAETDTFRWGLTAPAGIPGDSVVTLY